MEQRLKEINRLIKFFPGERGRELWLGTLLQDFIRMYQELFEELPGYVRYPFLEQFGEFIERELKEIRKLRSTYGQEFAKIRQAKTVQELVAIRGKLTQVTGRLFRKSHAVMEAHELCTQYDDHLTLQIIHIVEEQLRKERFSPRGRYAWIRMGSAGRDEQTLIIDQDNLLVYEHPKDKDYFQQFSKRVVKALEKIGIALCDGDVMASNPNWRGTLEEWRKRLLEMAFKEESLVHCIILMDAKFAVGDATLASQFIQGVHRLPLTNLGLLREIADVATRMPIALGVFRGLKLERHGRHKGQLNAKLQGWMPLVLLVLVYALKYGVRETNTVKRIRALERLRHFDAKFSADLQEAYFTLTRHKILKQIEALKTHRKQVDYYLRPKDLSEAEQKKLLDALAAISQLQKSALRSFDLTKRIPGV